MTLDFSRVNWFYVSISIAIWLALVIARWRRGDISLSEQYLGWSRQNGQNGIHLNATDWVATASSSDGGPGEPNRVKAVIGISTAFWAVLLWFLAFPLHVVKWQ